MHTGTLWCRSTDSTDVLCFVIWPKTIRIPRLIHSVNGISFKNHFQHFNHDQPKLCVSLTYFVLYLYVIVCLLYVFSSSLCFGKHTCTDTNTVPPHSMCIVHRYFIIPMQRTRQQWGILYWNEVACTLHWNRYIFVFDIEMQMMQNVLLWFRCWWWWWCRLNVVHSICTHCVAVLMAADAQFTI